MWCKKQCSYSNPKYDLFLNLTRKFWSLNWTKPFSGLYFESLARYSILRFIAQLTVEHFFCSSRPLTELLYLTYAVCKNVLIVVLVKMPGFFQSPCFQCLCLCLSLFFCAYMHLWECKSTLYLTRSTPCLLLVISQLARSSSFLSRFTSHSSPDHSVHICGPNI